MDLKYVGFVMDVNLVNLCQGLGQVRDVNIVMNLRADNFLPCLVTHLLNKADAAWNWGGKIFPWFIRSNMLRSLIK
jgi:hypothetical protein